MSKDCWGLILQVQSQCSSWSSSSSISSASQRGLTGQKYKVIRDELDLEVDLEHIYSKF